MGDGLEVRPRLLSILGMQKMEAGVEGRGADVLDALERFGTERGS